MDNQPTHFTDNSILPWYDDRVKKSAAGRAGSATIQASVTRRKRFTPI